MRCKCRPREICVGVDTPAAERLPSRAGLEFPNQQFHRSTAILSPAGSSRVNRIVLQTPEAPRELQHHEGKMCLDCSRVAVHRCEEKDAGWPSPRGWGLEGRCSGAGAAWPGAGISLRRVSCSLSSKPLQIYALATKALSVLRHGARRCIAYAIWKLRWNLKGSLPTMSSNQAQQARQSRLRAAKGARPL